MPQRVPEAAELAEDIAEIKQRLGNIVDRLERGYVPRELYEARHTALRTEISLELARIRNDLDGKASTDEVASVKNKADSSFRISWGVLAVLAGTFVTFLVSVLSAAPT